MGPVLELNDEASLGESSSEDTTTSSDLRLELTHDLKDPSGRMSVSVGSPDSVLSTSFSVINYVGKSQRKTSQRPTVRDRKPYIRQQVSPQTSRVESADDNTSSSVGSSVDYSSESASIISIPIVENIADMVDLDENMNADERPQLQQPLNMEENLYRQPHAGSRNQRSMSVSSSGCSSSMDDRNSNFSPLGSISSCRCSSLSISDFDDDGFREDNSVSSMYSVLSSSRSYQRHHQLHHRHQNVPHHPNNTKGLFDIALKTVKLIRRNQELQTRLAQLQQETKAFIESVMANPENEPLRNRIHAAIPSRTSTPTLVVQK
ncbi:uncharacterized protein LOC129728105 isoform X2 [Wyeomyia smithii]|uniref:uncharacterized protein LOC129728105 isoform X2 n=1 Tax=Wyeomyia smithii TaxID=174621 RepID=UPI002467D79B|nr:uncharacterized protein LOC129728105 isoform X2 [Wyeomyia smithii]XP_055542472.1 uncharacterized protein LOC129728105 isoform X2 [Wyeomyia smithii]